MGIKMINDITVNIKNVSFCYEAGKNILNNISMSVCGDENIGLIGANGVGKRVNSVRGWNHNTI